MPIISSAIRIPGTIPARNRPLIETDINPPHTIIMMLGGMITPITEEHAVMATEKLASYPCFFIAGIISSAVPKDFFAGSLGEGLLPMLVMLAVGIPLYVCATGSVPIALGLIHMGISPGAALVFLVSGPATNAATLTTIWKILGKRGAVIFLATVVASALGSGYLLDFLLTNLSLSGHHAHDHSPGAGSGTSWFTLLNAIVLVAILGAGSLHSLLRRFRPSASTAAGDDSVKLAVNGMSCSHCVSRVEEALQSCEGVRTVSVQLKPGEAVVSGSNLDQDNLKNTICDLGFEAELQAT